jgi:hypothetical protein
MNANVRRVRTIQMNGPAKICVTADLEMDLSNTPKGFLTQGVTKLISGLDELDISISSVLEQRSLFGDKSYVVSIESDSTDLGHVLLYSKEVTLC